MNPQNDLRRLPVKSLHGIGRVKESAYARLGIYSVYDLLYFFPRAYENRGNITLLRDYTPDVKNAVILTVATEPKVSLIRKGMSILKFNAFDDSGMCSITYFNQDYLKDKFHVGSTFRFWGKTEQKNGRYFMNSPAAEPYSENISLPPFVSVYRLTEGLSGKQISDNINSALSLAAEYLPDPLPSEIREENSLCTLHFALRQIHFPNGQEELAAAKKRLIFEEFFVFSLGMSLNIRNITADTDAPPCADTDITPLTSLLPYSLTDAQTRAIDSIASDMSKSRPMGRIVVGDVGCGKTVCAAAAMYIAVKNGRQAALMAPTEILANQHYNDLYPIFEKLNIRCALLTGSTTASQKNKIYSSLCSSDPLERTDIVIGTHALISDKVEFFAPGLIVTDEQHRFGVGQRAALSRKNNHSHMLVMSATPIPRSLALILYGDLDMSKIDTMPPGRQTVDTFLVDESYRARLDAFIRKQADAGSQVYIVCPAVEEKEAEDDEIALSEISLQSSFNYGSAPKKPPLKAAVKYASELQNRLKGYKIAFVHGKMSAKEKDGIMKSFAAGDIQILVSTTVIEVGVNVPNASLMIVENAERFGLSQLHQLRGRVGRGQKKSYCVLVCGTKSKNELGENALRRLETMCRCHDGYQIAQEDLKLRGPGDFLANSGNDSIRQSGSVCFRIADMCRDTELLTRAFSCAKKFFASDPTLMSAPGLKLETESMFSLNSDIIS